MLMATYRFIASESCTKLLTAHIKLCVKMSKRHISVGQQMWALLYKNFLKQWRMKRETLLAGFFLIPKLWTSLLFQAVYLSIHVSSRSEMCDNFNDSNYIIAFATDSKTTWEIKNKVASAPFMRDFRIKKIL
ncbi:ATP-binding cassette sub-family A member 9 [Manis javanica]|nr:ATP-binding cassette sub-family A member 9 [Manis javanica]